MRLGFHAKTNIDADGRALLIDLLESAGLAESVMVRMFQCRDQPNRVAAPFCTRRCANLDGGLLCRRRGRDVLATLDRAWIASLQTCGLGASSKLAGRRDYDVINIGIGGPISRHGVLRQPHHDGPRCHFASNVDPADISGVSRSCDPRRRWRIVVSKTPQSKTTSNARITRHG
jgi:glucose-6-phosphate isomerase